MSFDIILQKPYFIKSNIIDIMASSAANMDIPLSELCIEVLYCPFMHLLRAYPNINVNITQQPIAKKLIYPPIAQNPI